VSIGVPVDSECSSRPRKWAAARTPNSSSRAHFYFVRDSTGKVHFRRKEAAQFDSNSVAVDLRDRASGLLFDRVRIVWRLAPGKFLGLPSKQAGAEFFDADKVGSRILLRHWQPGDRFQPIGMKTPVKLQDLFTNARIARSRRRELILGLTGDGDIFWVEGLRISERYKLSKSTIRRLHWRWHRL
jgi:tRNA(Ile)-lysidine synthase